MDKKELPVDNTQKVELTALVEELLASKDKPNKFLELLFCRRFLSVVAVVGAVVAKHYGLAVSDTELLSVAAAVGGLVLSHGLRAPSTV